MLNIENFTAMKEKNRHFPGFLTSVIIAGAPFWGDRFKSVTVENGETLTNCLAYIDLSPVRAATAEHPEYYRWNSLGYHIQSGNRDDFLPLDLGPVKCASLSLRDLNRASLQELGTMHAAERLRSYRRYVYEAGA